MPDMEMRDYIAAGFKNAYFIADGNGVKASVISLDSIKVTPSYDPGKTFDFSIADLVLDATFEGTWQFQPRNRKEAKYYKRFMWRFTSRFTPKIQHNIDRKAARMIRKYIKHLEFDLSWEAPDVY